MQDIKDVLIDTEINDIIDILRVYSVTGKQQVDHKHVPELFPSDAPNDVEITQKP